MWLVVQGPLYQHQSHLLGGLGEVQGSQSQPQSTAQLSLDPIFHDPDLSRCWISPRLVSVQILKYLVQSHGVLAEASFCSVLFCLFSHHSVVVPVSSVSRFLCLFRFWSEFCFVFVVILTFLLQIKCGEFKTHLNPDLLPSTMLLSKPTTS